MHPFIHLGNGLYLPSYVLIISVVYTLCLLTMYVRAQRLEKSVADTLDYCLAVMVGGFIGGRALHVFYEQFDHYRESPLDIFKIWQGGFVFYGGFLGAMAAAFLLARFRRQPLNEWLDFFTPVLPMGYGLGRVGCFLNGCCYGALCDWPWAVEFHQPGLPSGLRHPTALYATAWELLVTWPVVLFLRKKPGVFWVWLFFHGLGRLVMEHYRDDHRGPTIFNGITVSSMLSIVFLIVASGVGIFFLVRRHPKSP
jgi:phosphatidylglycerol---prolipoprotein diacylglyceryl transferase